MRQVKAWLMATLLVVLLGCGEQGSDTTDAAATATPAGLLSLVTADAAGNVDLPPLPTLLPTSTGANTAAPPPTRVTSTPGPTPTPIDFEQAVVTLTYAIPGLGLERSLSGTIASTIELFDAATGTRLTKSNQAAVLLEIQQVLENIELAPYPEECPGCVRLDYSLPLAGAAGSGWLQDETILASLENFFAANLGPHFPADTVLGLRRSASVLFGPHTLAVTADGRLWLWSGIAAEVNLPAAADGQGDALIAAAAAIDVAALATNYRADCPGNARETLFIGVETPILIAVQCPELALPTTLTPLYGDLAAALTSLIDAAAMPAELDRYLPLDGILYYERPDASLVLYPDGRVEMAPGAALVANTPISPTMTYTGNFTFTSPISLTQAIRSLDMLRGPLTTEITGRSLVTDTASLDPYLLILRDDVAVWAATWFAQPDPLAQYTGLLDRLLDELVQLALPTPTPAAEPAGTGTPEPLPSASPTAVAPTATITPTPDS